MLQPHEVGKFICNLIESDNFLNGQILEVKK
jgi:hypothetical protein